MEYEIILSNNNFGNFPVVNPFTKGYSSRHGYYVSLDVDRISPTLIRTFKEYNKIVKIDLIENKVIKELTLEKDLVCSEVTWVPKIDTRLLSNCDSG